MDFLPKVLTLIVINCNVVHNVLLIVMMLNCFVCILYFIGTLHLNVIPLYLFITEFEIEMSKTELLPHISHIWFYTELQTDRNK